MRSNKSKSRCRHQRRKRHGHKKKCRTCKIRCKIKVRTRSGIRFKSKHYKKIVLSGSDTVLPSQDTSRLTVYSYAVVNHGDSPVRARVEIGPTHNNFAQDQEIIIPPHTTKAIVPIRFLRLTRLVLNSEDPEQPTAVDVYFQSQTNR